MKKKPSFLFLSLSLFPQFSLSLSLSLDPPLSHTSVILQSQKRKQRVLGIKERPDPPVKVSDRSLTVLGIRQGLCARQQRRGQKGVSSGGERRPEEGAWGSQRHPYRSGVIGQEQTRAQRRDVLDSQPSRESADPKGAVPLDVGEVLCHRDGDGKGGDERRDKGLFCFFCFGYFF